MAQLAGINIGFGVDLSNVSAGLGRTRTMFQNFEKTLRMTRVEGIIKGDPFSATNKFFKRSTGVLEHMLRAWSDNVDTFNGSMNEFAEKTGSNIGKVVAQFQKLHPHIQAYKNLAKIKPFLGKWTAGTAHMDPKGFEGAIEGLGLEKIAGASTKIRLLIRKAHGLVKNETGRAVELGKTEIEDTLKRIEETSKKRIEKILPLYKKLGLQMKNAFKTIKTLQFKSDVVMAKDVGQAQERQLEGIRKLQVEEARLRTEIEADIDVKRNQLALEKNLQRQKELSGRLTSEQREKLAQLRHEETKVSAILKKKNQTLKELAVQHIRLKREIKEKINVEKNYEALMTNWQARLNLGAKLTNKQTLALKKFNIEKKKAARAGRGEEGFLSPTWFKQRARWFIQLRGFWAIWRGMSEGFRIVRQLEQEMANLQAITQATDAELLIMSSTLKKMARDFSVDIATIAQGMVKLGQAGLTATEVSVAIKAVTTLAVATMTDMATASDLVTTAMKAWNLEAKDTGYIVDVLAGAVNRSKITIKGLSTALQYVTGVADKVGMSLHETAAAIGVMANQGIKMSKTGTGLRSLLGELIRPSKRFGKELHKVGLTIYDVDVSTRGVIPVLKTLAKHGFDAVGAFRGLDRRAASAVSSLIKGADAVESFSLQLLEANVASEMASIQMETLTAKTTKMKNVFIMMIERVYKEYNPMLKAMVDGLSKVAKTADETSETTRTIFSWAGVTGIAAGLYYTVKMLFNIKLVKAAVNGLKLAFIGLKASWVGIIVTILGAFFIRWLNSLAKAKYALGELQKRLVKAQKEATNASSAYKNLTDDIEAYNKAIEEGNEEEKLRIRQRNEEINQIAVLATSNKDLIEQLEELKNKYKALDDQKRHSLMLTMAENIQAQLAAAEIERQKAVPKPYGRAEARVREGAYEPSPALTPEQIEASTKSMNLYKAAIISTKNIIRRMVADWKELHGKDAIRDFEQIKMELAGFNIILEDISKGNKAVFEDWYNSFAKISKKSAKIMSEINKMIKELGGKEGRLPEDVTPEAKTRLRDWLMKQYPEIEEFLKRDEKVWKRFLKAWEEDVNTTMTMVLKASEVLSGTITEKIFAAIQILQSQPRLMKAAKKEIAAAKGEKEKWNKVTMEEVALHLLLNATTSAVVKKNKDLKTVLKSLLKEGKAVVDVNAKWIEKLKEVEDKIKVASFSELERKLASIRAKYANFIRDIGADKLTPAQKKARVDTAKGLEKRETEALLALTEKNLAMKNRELELQLTMNAEVYKYAKKEEDIFNTYVKTLETLYAKYAIEGRLTKEAERRAKLAGKKYKLDNDTNDRAKASDAIRLASGKRMLDLTRKRAEIERSDKPKKERLLAVQQEMVTEQLKTLYALRELKMTDVERHQVNKDIVSAMQKQYDLSEAQRRAANPLIDAWETIKDNVKEVNDVIRDTLVQFVEGIGSGFAGVLTDITGGFQEQEQEVINLQAKLDQLNQQYQEALSEGNAEKAAELAEEMAKLRGEIDDLEDPLHNIGEAFRVFFKDVIDGIREMIVKWLVMQAITGAFAGGGFNDPANMFAAAGPGGMTFNAKGGVLPSNVVAFRKLSRGGITGSPTLALLGDNPSKKELVIPSENISKDSVSGYVRDREEQPITIINVITENDFATQMAKPGSGRVIVNRVLEDIDSSGPIAKQLGH